MALLARQCIPIGVEFLNRHSRYSRTGVGGFLQGQRITLVIIENMGLFSYSVVRMALQSKAICRTADNRSD
jgi:hypothetical protein